MQKLIHRIAVGFVVINMFLFCPAQALEQKEIESITVLADGQIAVALSELASLFTHEKTISVSATFGISEDQKKRIEDGESADLFITTDMQLIQQLKVKGLVDVYSIGRIASHHETHFLAAVVASENMTPARNFLAFLKSDEARKVFKKNGLSVP